MILSINYRLRCYRGLVNMYHDFFAHEIIGTSSELFSKISLMGAGIMLTWFLAKSLWLLANVKFKTN